MKYIIIDIEGKEIPILFPKSIQHNKMAGNFLYPVVSVGFVQIEANRTLTAYGKSDSLRKSARPIDSDILNSMKYE